MCPLDIEEYEQDEITEIAKKRRRGRCYVGKMEYVSVATHNIRTGSNMEVALIEAEKEGVELVVLPQGMLGSSYKGRRAWTPKGAGCRLCNPPTPSDSNLLLLLFLLLLLSDRGHRGGGGGGGGGQQKMTRSRSRTYSRSHGRK